MITNKSISPHFCFLTGLYSRKDVLMFERQGKSLVKAGFKVSYVVCDEESDSYAEGVHFISTKYTPTNRIDRFLHTKRILLKKAIEVNADIYQISDPELISIINPLKQLKKIVVFNLREFYPEMITHKYYIPKIIRKLAAKGYEVLMKHELKKYDAVFTVTDWIVSILRDKYGIKQTYLLTNFPVVNNSISFSFEEYSRRGDVLCYEGTIYVTSRQENVFQALEQLKDVHYILAGKIDDTYNWIKDLPYWEKVEFVNGFNYSELQSIFDRSTIGNVFRDFGGKDGSLGVLKVFETMDAALPVLFADVPLYREINEKYHCGICVDPNSVSSIENAIRYLVENKLEAYTMGQNGKKAVIEEYNWERQAALYLSVITELLITY